MSKSPVLERAIKIAVEHGWLGLSGEIAVTIGHVANKGYDNYSVAGHNFGSLEALIFNHDFAKALWGEEYYADDTFNDNGRAIKYVPEWSLPNWQHHLQQMVIAPDLLTYLQEHLPHE